MSSPSPPPGHFTTGEKRIRFLSSAGILYFKRIMTALVIPIVSQWTWVTLTDYRTTSPDVSSMNVSDYHSTSTTDAILSNDSAHDEVITYELSAVFLISPILSLLFSPLAGTLADKHGRDLPLIIGMAIILVMIIFFAVSTDFILIFIAKAAEGISQPFLTPIVLARIWEVYPSDSKEGKIALAVAMTANFFSFFGSVYSGLMIENFGQRTCFLTILPIHIALVLSVLWSYRSQCTTKEGNKSNVTKLRTLHTKNVDDITRNSTADGSQSDVAIGTLQENMTRNNNESIATSKRSSPDGNGADIDKEILEATNSDTKHGKESDGVTDYNDDSSQHSSEERPLLYNRTNKATNKLDHSLELPKDETKDDVEKTDDARLLNIATDCQMHVAIGAMFFSWLGKCSMEPVFALWFFWTFHSGPVIVGLAWGMSGFAVLIANVVSSRFAAYKADYVWAFLAGHLLMCAPTFAFLPVSPSPLIASICLFAYIYCACVCRYSLMFLFSQIAAIKYGNCLGKVMSVANIGFVLPYIFAPILSVTLSNTLGVKYMCILTGAGTAIYVPLIFLLRTIKQPVFTNIYQKVGKDYQVVHKGTPTLTTMPFVVNNKGE